MYWLTLTLLLIPLLLNTSFLILLTVYTISYTTPFALPLRNAGTRSFNIINIVLIIYAVSTGLLNCYLLHSWFTGSGVFKPRRLEKERIERQLQRYGLKPMPVREPGRVGRGFASSGGISNSQFEREKGKSWVRRVLQFGLFLVGAALPLVLALVLPDVVSRAVWRDGCKGWDLMAEIETPYPTTLQSFPYERSEVDGELWNVSTRVEFYERGKWVYGMDLFRRLDEPLGFPVDERSGSKKKAPLERVIIFTTRNSTAPYSDTDPKSYVYSGLQIFPSHPYLPAVLSKSKLITALTSSTNSTPENPTGTTTIPSRRYPLFGSPYAPLTNTAALGRIIYHLHPKTSHYSLLPSNSTIPGIHPPEQRGTFLTAPTTLLFSGPLALNTPDNHRWRYIHPDILYGKRKEEVCLPPNPKLVVPGFIDPAIGAAVVRQPAYHTPWLPPRLKGVEGSERCRTWRVCGGGRGVGGSVVKKSMSATAEAGVWKRAVEELWEVREGVKEVGKRLGKRWGVKWDVWGGEVEGEEWIEELRKTWAVVVGLLAYEVEGWSECCMRGD